MSSSNKKFNTSPIGKAVKATLPFMALMGGNAFASSRVGSVSRQGKQAKATVFVDKTNSKSVLTANLQPHADTTEESLKKRSKRSAFGAFTHKGKGDKKQTELKADNDVLAFLKANDVFSPQQNVLAQLSGDTRKQFAAVNVGAPWGWPKTVNGTCSSNPQHRFYQVDLGGGAGSCLISHSTAGTVSSNGSSVACQNMYNACFSVAPADDADGSLTAAGGVSEPVNIPTTADTVGEAVDVFDFTLSDGGTADGNSMDISQIVVNVLGTSTDSERDDITWRLNGADAANVTGVYSAIGDTITFSGLSISIADGGNEIYTVNAYFNDNTTITDNSSVVLSVDGDTDVTVSGGTSMGATSAVNNGAGTALEVSATALAFTTQPSGSVSGSALTTQPVVTAQDAFGNTDTDFSEIITLTEASAGSLSGNAVTASSGVATFISLNYSATADGQSFTLTANDQDGVGTDLPTVDANAVTADVIATKLIFSTEPAPTTVDSGAATDFTTVPVVQAVNASDIVDTGYSTGIVLAEVNGAGSATMTATGDTDGSGTTVTLTPSSGVATYTGMQITYTASGGIDENFNLQASSGGLTTANSVQLTATVADVTSPTVTSVSVPANSTYTAAANLDFTVNFDENVTVNTGGGTPRLTLTIGATTRYADYLSGSGSSALVFRYTVPASDQDLDGVALNGTLDVNGGTLQDAAGNDANTTLNSVGSLAAVFVDALAPTVAEVTPVTTPTSDSTPDLTFSTDEAGTLVVGGSCGSASEGAVSAGNNTIALTQTDNSTALTGGTYTDCTVTVTDSAGNASNLLTLTSFTVDVAAPTVDTNTGDTVDEASTGGVISAATLTASDNLSAAANVTYTLVSVPSNGTLRNGGTALSGTDTFTQADIAANTITYDHDGSETVADTFTFTVADGLGNVNNNGASNFTFNITVTPQPDAPTVSGAPTDITVIEDTASNVDLSPVVFVDPDSSPITVTLTTSAGTFGVPADGAGVGGGVTETLVSATQITLAGAATDINTYLDTVTNIQYTGAANVEGDNVATLTVSATDGALNLATNPVVNIDITNSNDAPVAVNDSATTAYNTAVAINVAANDTDIDAGDSPDATTIVVVGAATSGSAVFNGATNQIDYTPNSGFSGADSFTYTIDDGSGATSNVATVNVTVGAAPVNSAPEFTSTPTQSVVVDTLYSYEIVASDSDDASLTITVSTLPSWLELTSTGNKTATLSGTPTATDVGSIDITLTVSDGSDTDTQSFSVAVVTSNTAPYRAYSSPFTAMEDASLTQSLVMIDDEADELTYEVTVEPTNGEVTISGDEFTYVPNQNYVGEDSFTVVANDGELDSAPSVYELTVQNVNDAPVANNDTITVAKSDDDTYLIDPLMNDTDADIDNDVAGEAPEQLTLQGANATVGEVTIVDGKLSYKALDNFLGSVDIDYSIRDNAGESAQATVTLTVEGDQVDDSLPVITPPPNLEVNATGLFTSVDLGVATAVDANGNPLPLNLVENKTSFAPGKHIIYWQAEDAQGNKATAEQEVIVHPMISISKDQVVTEGSTVSVKVLLNGTAPSYPLTVPYTVSGTADSNDHNAQSGEVTFEQGTEQTISFDVLADEAIEGDETIIVTLDSSFNLGANSTSTFTISAANLAPEISLSVEQSGEQRLTVAQDQGQVTITGVVTDANLGDVVTVEWASFGLDNLSASDETFVFDPSLVSEGIYQVLLFAYDDALPVATNQSSVFIEVTDTLAALSVTSDTDGDLIPDDQEGYSDSDSDGIPDYLDAIADCNVVPQQAAVQDSFLIESEPGVCMRRGSTSLLSENGGLSLTDDEANNKLGQDDDTLNVGGVFDFVAYGLPESGASYNLVIPQTTPVPEGAVYRKFSETKGWYTFEENERNKVYSALGSGGHCPPPSDDSYTTGLTIGHWCVQLSIEDGGPNDDDGERNGAIVDPGGVAVWRSENSQPVAEADNVTTKFNTTVVIDVLANDTDADEGDILSVLNVSATFGDVELNADNTITYTPAENYYGSDTVSYTISDGNGGTAFSHVNVTVQPNSLPVVEGETASTTNDTAITVDVLANDTDADGDVLTLVNVVAQSGTVEFDSAGTITYTPNSSFTGDDVITYNVSDGVNTVEGTLTITVTEAEPEPVLKKKSGGSTSIWFILLSLVAITRYRNKLKFK